MATAPGSKSVASGEKGASRRPKSWLTCSSKFQIILGNLERTIMSQFQNSSEATNTIKRKGHNISSPIAKSSAKGMPNGVPQSDANATQQAKSKTHDDGTNLPHLARDTRQQKDLALPTKTESTDGKGKATLNKQQHESTGKANHVATSQPYQYNQPFVEGPRMYSSNQVPMSNGMASGGQSHQFYQNMNQVQAYQYQQQQQQQPCRSLTLDNRQGGEQVSLQPRVVHMYQPGLTCLPATHNASLDSSGQEIYVNAPPKPRRYQYYEEPEQYFIKSLAPNLSINMNASTVSAMPTRDNVRNSYDYRFRDQHQPSSLINQPFPHAGPFIPVQNMYPQPNQQHHLVFNDEQVNQANFYPTARQTQYAPMLTKSRSNLDFHDINQYKMSSLNFYQNHQPMAQRVIPSQNNIFRSPVTCAPSYQPDRQDLFRDRQFAMMSNLQRSKSVTHLAADMNQEPRGLVHPGYPVHNNFATLNPKFLAVSSASTTNLHRLCEQVDHNMSLKQNSHISRLSSQHLDSLGANQMQRFNQPLSNVYKQQSTPMFCATAQRQDQQQHLDDDWHSTRTSARNTDQQIPRQATQRQPRLGGRSNSAFSIGGKLSRQMAPSLRHGEPTLDDKIRCLMIDEDSSGAANNDKSFLSQQKQVSSSNSVGQACSNETKCQADNVHVTDHKLAWIAPSNNQQASKQFSAISANPLPNGDLSNVKMTYDTNQRLVYEHQTPLENRSNLLIPQNQESQPNSRSDLFPVVYPKNQATGMGNRQQRHYHVNEVGPQQTNISPIIPPRKVFNDSPQTWATGINSQLIVDLTTPRVLAKTKTTLSSTNLNADTLSQKGAQAQNHNDQMDAPTDSNMRHDSSSDAITDPNLGQANQLRKTDDGVEGAPQQVAPYYYSDLKSQEQRQALLSIVQQKSLSPPPQLLSRSADQGSTRLAVKSATSHNDRHLSKSIHHHYDQSSNNLDKITCNGSKGSPSDKDKNGDGEVSENSTRDEEDFIEFMRQSPDERSKFEASEFNASDFVSDVSASSMDQDKNAEVNKSAKLVNGPGIPGGILKNSRTRQQQQQQSTMMETNNNNVVDDSGKEDKQGNKNENDLTNGQRGNSIIRDDGNEFNDVLGNVIDVDVCPMNNWLPRWQYKSANSPN